MALYQDSINIGEELTIERLGLLLGLGYTFTDFFAQGVSFKKAAWFIHLFLTGRGNRLCAGNIRVPLTRPGSLDDVCLLAPLYSNEKEKEALVQKFILAFKPDPAYVAEMARLEALQVGTIASLDKDYGGMQQQGSPPTTTSPPRPPPTPMAAPASLVPSSVQPRANTPHTPVSNLHAIIYIMNSLIFLNLFHCTLQSKPHPSATSALSEAHLYRPKDFKFRTGDCFFDALSHLIDPTRPRSHSKALRKLLAQWLSNALLTDNRDVCAPVLQHLLRLSFEPNAPASLKAYLHGLRAPASKGGHWADNATAFIACKALGINMTIYSYDMTSGSLQLKDHTHWPETALRARLFFSGTTDSGHYEPLRLTIESSTTPLNLLIVTHLNNAHQRTQLDLEESIPLWSSTEGLTRIRQFVWSMMLTDSPNNLMAAYYGTDDFMKFITEELDTSSAMQHAKKKKKLR